MSARRGRRLRRRIVLVTVMFLVLMGAFAGVAVIVVTTSAFVGFVCDVDPSAVAGMGDEFFDDRCAQSSVGDLDGDGTDDAIVMYLSRARDTVVHLHVWVRTRTGDSEVDLGRRELIEAGIDGGIVPRDGFEIRPARPGAVELQDFDGDGGAEIVFETNAGASDLLYGLLTVVDGRLAEVQIEGPHGVVKPLRLSAQATVMRGRGYFCRDVDRNGDPELVMRTYELPPEEGDPWTWTEDEYDWVGKNVVLIRQMSGREPGSADPFAAFGDRSCSSPVTESRIPPPATTPTAAAAGLLAAWRRGDRVAAYGFAWSEKPAVDDVVAHLFGSRYPATTARLTGCAREPGVLVRPGQYTCHVATPALSLVVGSMANGRSYSVVYVVLPEDEKALLDSIGD